MTGSFETIANGTEAENLLTLDDIEPELKKQAPAVKFILEREQKKS